MKEIRILISKPGLDGHDKGAKLIALALQNDGMKVFYSGLHKSINEIITKAKKNSVNFIGLSIMTGSHFVICKKCIEEIKKRNIKNMKIIVGGIIPNEDIEKLIEIGITAVFPNGTKINFIIKSIKKIFQQEDKHGNC